MFIGNRSDEDVFESLFMAKHKNKNFLENVGVDYKNNEYFYVGNNVFLRKEQSNGSSFSLMELPVSCEKNGNVAKIDVVPDEGVIKFYAPLCSGYQVLVFEAVWEGLDFGWNLISKINNEVKQNESLVLALDNLEKSTHYGSRASKYAKSLRNIIENTLLLEEQRKENDNLLKKRK